MTTDTFTTETTATGMTINCRDARNGNEIVTILTKRGTWSWEYRLSTDTTFPTLCGSGESTEKAAIMAANRAYRAWLEE